MAPRVAGQTTTVNSRACQQAVLVWFARFTSSNDQEKLQFHALLLSLRSSYDRIYNRSNEYQALISQLLFPSLKIF